MKYIIIIKFENSAELVYRVDAENSRMAVARVMHELTDIQCNYVRNIQVIKEFRELEELSTKE